MTAMILEELNQKMESSDKKKKKRESVQHT
jgi:hypothetical protein